MSFHGDMLPTGNNSSSMNNMSSSIHNDDVASQSSQRSARSLLERIQAQREREKLQQTAGGKVGGGGVMPVNQDVPTTPQQIQVPQYSPNPNPAMMNNPYDGNHQQLPTSSPNAAPFGFLSNAWSNISESMEQGMASLSASAEVDMETRDALLAPSAQSHPTEEYSMGRYFMTFVGDMYGLFQSLPVAARWIVCLVLLYIALKLL